MKIYYTLLFFTLISFCNNTNVIFAQKRLPNYVSYIEKYCDIAIKHQKKYLIPASITLSQGLLESGAGNSKLTKESNNHFGIKCHSEWKGQRVYADDDAKNECFRKYKNAEESYDDHSRFLVDKPRYSKLFELDIYDYKNWAKTLQKSGYATDKGYANKLIKLIEDYELYEYDKEGKPKKGKAKKEKKQNEIKYQRPRIEREVFRTHGLIYVVAKENDNFDAIAYDMDFKVKNLIKYNEVPEDFPLYKGDIVYLEKKKNKADSPYFEHVVKVGESMHSISQKYGVKLSKIYKMNKLNMEYTPAEGDVLRLR